MTANPDPHHPVRAIALDVWHSFRKAWWNLLWSSQDAGRVAAKRFRKTTLLVMFLRVVLHWIVGAWPVLLVKAALWYFIGGRTALVASVAVLAVSFMVYVLATNGERDMTAPGGGTIARWLMSKRFIRKPVAWKLSMRTRGRWPADWAKPAAKTKRVQAEVGTSREPRVTIRPVLDHPKISWWPKVNWPVVSWWVSPPPGRSFEEFDRMLDVLAANMLNVVSIELDYERRTSSIGRMSVLFADPLADPGRPVWDESDFDEEPVTVPDDPTAVFDLDQDEIALADVIPIVAVDRDEEIA